MRGIIGKLCVAAATTITIIGLTLALPGVAGAKGGHYTGKWGGHSGGGHYSGHWDSHNRGGHWGGHWRGFGGRWGWGGYGGGWGWRGFGWGLGTGLALGGFGVPYYGGSYDDYNYYDPFGSDCYIGRRWVINRYGDRVLGRVLICSSP
jgi:hypothetical protein